MIKETMRGEDFIALVVEVLMRDERVVFAYLYGSVVTGGRMHDVDIAVFAGPGRNPHELSADLKVALHAASGLPPDAFDVRVLNEVFERGDVFGLLYLRNVLSSGLVLVDKDPDLRAECIELYSRRYRECEGMIKEVLA